MTFIHIACGRLYIPKMPGIPHVLVLCDFAIPRTRGGV